ncbi:hypothetical protein PHLCEN_2v2452 [Hermanssonia centrifuga]|uniref:Thioredoxin domain-containing protein n=1 Tax=Hermanssonia centrifuga TaxID=98765 RepID=A0A2R6RLW1_9APHY|nr:hypothetical protein PHLCEN_2v2452 [Hermanssonia centrifuga]
MPVTPITSLEQFRETIKSDKVTVFDFWASWCGPCKAISPVYEHLSNITPEVEFYNVNVDQQPEITEEMPTFMAFKRGQKINEVLGSNPDNLEVLLNTSESASKIVQSKRQTSEESYGAERGVLRVRTRTELE